MSTRPCVVLADDHSDLCRIDSASWSNRLNCVQELAMTGYEMPFPRSSGVLLHVTSLPGAEGIGDFGKPAFDFVDRLAAAGQSYWQVLPLGPTSYGDSPYQSFSSFAGNTS